MKNKTKDKQITFRYNHFLFKETINDFLLKKGFSSDYIYQLIKNKLVLINHEAVRDKNVYLPRLFSIINVRLLFENNDIPPKKGKLDILYEDKYLLILHKPPFIEIEPSKKNYYNTFSNIVSYYYEATGIHSKIHINNRLDYVTSGITVFAKNGYVHHMLQDVKMTKLYKTFVKGKVDKSGTINVKVKKSSNGIERVVDDAGKEAITKYKLLHYYEKEDISLVEVRLITGRTHQIRLSFNHIGHPIVGDKIYGNIPGKFVLTCYKMKFRHPFTKKKMCIETKFDNIYENNKD